MNRPQSFVKVLLSALLILGLAGVFFARSGLAIAQQGSVETGEGLPNAPQGSIGDDAAELTPVSPQVNPLTGDGFAPQEASLAPAAAPLADGDQMSHWSILGSHLQARRSGLQFVYFGNGCIYITNDGGDLRMQIPVILPDGSIIKSMDIFFRDTNVSSNLTVWLTRYIPGSTSEDVTWVASSGSAGYGTSSSPEITHVVDNTQAYTLNYSWDFVLNDTLQICGVRINYIDPFYSAFLPVIIH